MTDPNLGRRLSNRYHLVELAGKGAMGRVYRAEDTLLGGVNVAVKFLAQTLLNQRMRDRFEREATICALLAEKTMHIVRVKDYGVDDHDVPYYVMEFLQGENLSDMIKANAIPFGRCLSIVRQVCRGLNCAHQGILFGSALDYCGEGEDILPTPAMVSQSCSLCRRALVATVLPDPVEITHH